MAMDDFPTRRGRPDEREIELEVGATTSSGAQRINALRELVTDHFNRVSSRYPALFAKITNPRSRPHMMEILDRDFTLLKLEMVRGRVRATRPELTDAFRDAIETRLATAPIDVNRRSSLYYDLLDVYHRIVHGDADLRVVYPPEDAVTRQLSIVPVEPGALAKLAASVAAKAYEARKERIVLGDINDDPVKEVKYAMIEGASAAMDAIHAQGASPLATALIEWLEGAAEAAATRVHELAPRQMPLLSAPMKSAHTRETLGVLGERMQQTKFSAAARVVTAHLLPAPEAVDHVAQTLSELDVPVKARRQFAEEIHKLAGEPSQDINRTTSRVAQFIHATAEAWMRKAQRGELTSFKFGQNVRAICRFVAQQRYHGAMESAVHGLMAEMEDRTNREIQGIIRKDPHLATDYEQIYERHPHIGLWQHYVSALQGAHVILSEIAAKQRPFG